VKVSFFRISFLSSERRRRDARVERLGAEWACSPPPSLDAIRAQQRNNVSAEYPCSLGRALPVLARIRAIVERAEVISSRLRMFAVHAGVCAASRRLERARSAFQTSPAPPQQRRAVFALDSSPVAVTACCASVSHFHLRRPRCGSET